MHSQKSVYLSDKTESSRIFAFLWFLFRKHLTIRAHVSLFTRCRGQQIAFGASLDDSN